MKNKKGMTLTEILVCIGLLALIALVIGISLINVNNRQKQSAYNNVIENICSASKTFVGLNRNDIRDFLKNEDNPNTTTISLSDLIMGGLLDEGIKDPRTNETICPENPDTNRPTCPEKTVTIEYNSETGDFTYTYNHAEDDPRPCERD